MVVQLNSSGENLDDVSEFSIQKKHSQDHNSPTSEELYGNSHNVKLIERKPQAMNEDSGKKVVYNPVQHITKQQKHNIEMDYRMNQIQKLVKSENYEYEEDIENAIIEDESESNEEDQSEDLDEMQDLLLDENINFQKIKNLTFVRPKLKFQEVPKYVKPMTQIVQTTISTTSAVVRNVVVDGIFWSDEVHQLVPKGNLGLPRKFLIEMSECMGSRLCRILQGFCCNFMTPDKLTQLLTGMDNLGKINAKRFGPRLAGRKRGFS
ncbi:hypothetical protein LOTGIDRAFT_172941 [Lottia gigantea]|uniref:Uncharacterized protein n=1 Tax=Lottia gigantea TaxID=225164 RepID=V4AAE5_LOTGI|nr:hypothetical protein LOTGIDRAFT_172941 [Lottia gigantea]ESP00934.1 hypothetical protein LOTGIDRAFT_172941 [Lottia gigantea]